MKKLNIFWFVLVLCLTNQYGNSQNIGDLNGIFYQAVAIDENGKEIIGMDVEGKPLFEKTINVKFTITKGLNGVVQYEETHTTTTDRHGLFSLIIGQGTHTGNGAYSSLLDIPWIDADQFLKVDISTKNDGNYVLVSNQQFMSVPYSFYTDDIADNAITTAKILNEEVLSEDIASDAVTTSEVKDSTIASVDIKSGAIDSRTVLNETILAEDIATGAITSTEILDATVTNQDIADSTIDLTTKVDGVLPVENGGMGNTSLPTDHILVGDGTNPIRGKVLVSADTSIQITQTADSIIIKGKFAASEVLSDPAGTFVIGNLPAGTTYTSNAINAFDVNFGDIIIGSIDVNLQGCMLTAYVSQQNVIRISVFNGTGGPVNLGTVNVRVFVVR
jgi:hypothetical protein